MAVIIAMNFHKGNFFKKTLDSKQYIRDIGSETYDNKEKNASEKSFMKSDQKWIQYEGKLKKKEACVLRTCEM